MQNAHEKLKVVRSHRILPYGTLLEFNIGNDVTLDEHDPRENVSVMEVETHFLDMTLSDVESDDVEADDVESAPSPSMSCKRKLP